MVQVHNKESAKCPRCGILYSVSYLKKHINDDLKHINSNNSPLIIQNVQPEENNELNDIPNDDNDQNENTEGNEFEFIGNLK